MPHKLSKLSRTRKLTAMICKWCTESLCYMKAEVRIKWCILKLHQDDLITLILWGWKIVTMWIPVLCLSAAALVLSNRESEAFRICRSPYQILIRPPALPWYCSNRSSWICTSISHHKQASPDILNSLFMKGFLEQNIIMMPARWWRVSIQSLTKILTDWHTKCKPSKDRGMLRTWNNHDRSLTCKQESVVSAAHSWGNPSPLSIVERARQARIPSLWTARAIPGTCCPPASAKHVTWPPPQQHPQTIWKESSATSRHLHKLAASMALHIPW